MKGGLTIRTITEGYKYFCDTYSKFKKRINLKKMKRTLIGRVTL